MCYFQKEYANQYFLYSAEEKLDIILVNIFSMQIIILQSTVNENIA